MTKDELKEYICRQIDLMDEMETSELAQFLQGRSEDESVAEELIVIKGEFKKLTKLVQLVQEGLENIKKVQTKEELKPFLTFYTFLKNSQDALASMPKNSLFGISKFNRAFGAFENGFESIEMLYADIMQNMELQLSAKVGDRFDSNFHEAIELIEDKRLEDGIIVEVLEDGFIYKNELLNYAKVKVNRWI